jgi:hypothetical protein
VAQSGSGFAYGDPVSDVDDSPALETLARLHLGVIRAAFQCDLLRVATFQWTSARNKTSFKGLNPADPEQAYMHGPMGARVTEPDAFRVAPPSDADDLAVIEYMANVHAWFNRKTAEILLEFKNATDAFGGKLLDHTVVPFFTEITDPTDSRSPLPALILGGRALGMQGGQFVHFEAPRNWNDLLLTIAQPYFPNAASVVQPLAAEAFLQDETRFTGPIAGLWAKP